MLCTFDLAANLVILLQVRNNAVYVGSGHTIGHTYEGALSASKARCSKELRALADCEQKTKKMR